MHQGSEKRVPAVSRRTSTLLQAARAAFASARWDSEEEEEGGEGEGDDCSAVSLVSGVLLAAEEPKRESQTRRLLLPALLAGPALLLSLWL